MKCLQVKTCLVADASHVPCKLFRRRVSESSVYDEKINVQLHTFLLQTCFDLIHVNCLCLKYCRVVARYMGSGIKGLQESGIRITALGSGIMALGSRSAPFFIESGIRLQKAECDSD